MSLLKIGQKLVVSSCHHIPPPYCTWYYVFEKWKIIFLDLGFDQVWLRPKTCWNFIKMEPYAYLSNGYPNLLLDFRKDKICNNRNFPRLWILKIWEYSFEELNSRSPKLSSIAKKIKLLKIETNKNSGIKNLKVFIWFSSSTHAYAKSECSFNAWGSIAKIDLIA